MGFALRLGIVFLLMTGAAACGGSSATPTAPTPPTVGPAPQPASSLPLGSAGAGGGVACPSGLGSPANSSCSSLVVTCPSVAVASATLRITRPPAGIVNRGTIVLSTGSAGTNFQDSPLTPGMISTLGGDGLTAVQLAWDTPGIWGDARARTVACRYATAVRWIYDNVHTGGRSQLFAAQGTSGGAAQIAFGLAHYGIGDFLDLANLGGGPPRCPLCPCDGRTATEPLLPLSLSNGGCKSPPPSERSPLLAYPSTAVRFFLGDHDPNDDGTADSAREYFVAITSSRTFATAPNTPHVVETTQAGVDAYIGSVRSALK